MTFVCVLIVYFKILCIRVCRCLKIDALVKQHAVSSTVLHKEQYLAILLTVLHNLQFCTTSLLTFPSIHYCKIHKLTYSITVVQYFKSKIMV